MYSVFDSKQEIREKYGVNAVRPLADNTMRRIIRGVDKYTIRSGRPFIVPTGYGERKGQAPRVHDLARPLPTVVSICKQNLAAANLIQYHTEQTETVRANDPAEPLPTVDASNRYGLTAAHLTEYYGNGNPLDLREPMHTVTGHDREALTAVHLDKYFAGGYKGCGNGADEPVATVTAEPRQSLVAAHIAEFKGQDKGQDMRKPLRTVTAYGGEFAAVAVRAEKYGGEDLGRWPLIRALLNRYCGYTLGDDEVLLLRIGKAWYYISDISMRMLTPRELYAAMGFPPDYIIDRDYLGREYPKTQQVARCGNAVCPPMASAVVRANMPEWSMTITTMAELMRHMAV